MNTFFSQLADFVDQRTDWIIETWLRALAAKGDLRSAENLTRDQLIDHLPAVCRDLAERLRTAGRGAASDECENATSHGVVRWQQGYQVGELIGEADLVRQIVTGELLTAFVRETGGADENTRLEAQRVMEQFFTDMLVASADQYAALKEKALKAWEQSSQAILDAALDCIIVMGDDGRVQEWNPAAEQLFGYARRETIGRELADLIIPPELRARHRQGIAHFLATGEGPLLGRRIEVSAVRADGTSLMVELAIAAHQTDEAWGFTAYVRDITERKANEAASQRLAAIVQSSGDAIIAKDLTGLITSWNAGAERLFGFSAAEMVGQPITTVIPPHLHAEESGILARIGGGELIENYDTVRRRKDGRLLKVSLTISPIRDQNGKVIGISKIGRDITERVQSDARRAAEYAVATLTSGDEALPEIASRLLEAVALSSRWIFGALWLRHEDGPITCHATWRSAGAAVDRFEHETRGHVFAPGEGLPGRVIASGQAVWIADMDAESHLPRAAAARAGGLHSVLLFPLVAPSGVCGAIELFSDEILACDQGLLDVARVLGIQVGLYIERKRTEEELLRQKEAAEAANQAKDRFLAALSHELRTPLNPVLMWACAALDDQSLDARIREGLQMVCRNVELEARLIDDLLDLTRIARGKLKLNLQPRDASKLLQHALEIVRSQLSGKRLHVSMNFGASNHVVQADSTRLEQVFWNLLKNACQFTPSGGEIAIRSYDAAPGVLALEISDTGSGIDPALMPKLFTAFEQGRTGRSEGLGLGLAICKGIVEMHGGTLSAGNKADGRGAVFRLELGTLAEHETTGATTRSAGTLPSRKLRILVVEDHPETADVIGKLLERAGHDTIIAMTVHDALAILASTELDVLVSDVGLPDGSGLDVMRELARTSSAKGIAVSGYGMEEDLRRSHEAGFSAHLTKPINVQDLTRAIEQVTAGG